MGCIIHPPVEGGLRIAAAVDDFARIGGSVSSRSHAFLDGGTVRAAMAEQIVASHVDAMSLGGGIELCIDRQRWQPVLGTSVVDQGCELIDITGAARVITACGCPDRRGCDRSSIRCRRKCRHRCRSSIADQNLQPKSLLCSNRERFSLIILQHIKSGVGAIYRGCSQLYGYIHSLARFRVGDRSAVGRFHPVTGEESDGISAPVAFTII